MRSLIDLVENTATFFMWHGSKKWDGSPEIRAPRAKRYEAGPGIYFTTNYHTAYRYAKGGGSTFLGTLDRSMRLAEDALIPLDAALQFVKEAPRMRHKAEIAADLKANTERRKTDSIAAVVLINLVVNYEAGSGAAGLAVARFLREQGIDASLAPQSNEDWLVVINPKIILSMRRVTARDVTPDMYHLPRISR
jgi:hypothetical protein